MFVAPLVAFVFASWAHRNILDDGFIYLRVVHQVTAGHGPVYNMGERVEAFTSPLWLGALSIADLIAPIRLEWIAVVMGIAATVGGLVLSVLGSAKLIRQHEPEALLVPFGVLVLVALTPMWFYATSGLETGLVFLWMGLSLWMLASWSSSGTRMKHLSGTVLGLGWLVRPELAVYSVAFLAVVLAVQWRVDTWRDRVKFLAAALALPVAYQVFRMGYYGTVVANTAIAKEGTRINWSWGWSYLKDFVSAYWFIVPLLIVFAGGYVPLARGLRRGSHPRAVWVLWAFPVAAALNAFYIVAVGGDYEHARLLLPAVFALCTPIAAVPATRQYIGAFAAAPWVIAAVFVLRPPQLVLGSTYFTPPVGRVTTNDSGWGGGSAKLAQFTDNGLYLQVLPRLVFYRAEFPLASTVRQPEAAIFAIGVVPYAAGNRLHVVDLFGLADPISARLKVPTTTSGLLPYPGQEKPLPNPWIAARTAAPDAQIDDTTFLNQNNSIIRRAKGAAFDRQVSMARAALDCPPIKQLNRDTEAPLTISRFFGNIFDSFSNTRLRIPPDPTAAYEKLCGTTGAASAPQPRFSPHHPSDVRMLPEVFARWTPTAASTRSPAHPDRSTEATLPPSVETNAGGRPLVAVAGFV